MLISAHDLVTAALVHLCIGSCIWMVLDGLGVIGNSFRDPRMPKSKRALVLATLMMIAGWPVFVWLWLKGMLRGARS